MTPNMRTIAVRFDIDKIESGGYGELCWKLFWRAVSPTELAGALLFEGDTGATLAGEENVFCIAVQSADRDITTRVKTALSHSEGFKRVCASQMFVQGTKCTKEPLRSAGQIDACGNLVGHAGASRAGLNAVSEEIRTTTQATERLGTAPNCARPTPAEEAHKVAQPQREEAADKWFLLPRGQKKQGPFALQELQDYCDGRLFYDGLRVRRTGDQEWCNWGDVSKTYPELVEAGIVQVVKIRKIVRVCRKCGTKTRPKLAKESAGLCESCRRIDRLWFIGHCLVLILLFGCGSYVLQLGWFWNSLFSLLSLWALVFATQRIVASRFCLKRVTRALDSGASVDAIRKLAERAFGESADVHYPSDVGKTGLIAYVPFVILTVRLLAPSPISLPWQIVLGFLIAAVCSLLLATWVNSLASQELAMKRFKDLLVERAPDMWMQTSRVWEQRRSPPLVRMSQEEKDTGSCTSRGRKRKGLVKRLLRGGDDDGLSLEELSKEFYTCQKCGADASDYASMVMFSVVAGNVPFGRCKECRKLWCRNCAKEGVTMTCPSCGGELLTNI